MTEPEWTVSHPSGSGRGRYYVVEARTTYVEPQTVHGILLTERWKQIPTTTVPPGTLVTAGDIHVPRSDMWSPHAAEHGLLGREEAYSLAVQFQTGHLLGSHLCVETRLVEVELKWSYDITEVGVTEPFSLFEHLRYLQISPRDPAPTQTTENAMTERTA